MQMSVGAIEEMEADELEEMVEGMDEDARAKGQPLGECMRLEYPVAPQ